jgi:hypothetical protein
MEGSLNTLVYDYLTSLGTKLADKFKKEFQPKALPPGSPSLKEIVHNHMNSPKRKPEVQASPAVKKAKKVACIYMSPEVPVNSFNVVGLKIWYNAVAPERLIFYSN